MAIKSTDVQVQLIDPNSVNINDNPNFPNGIAQYQDMFIFAELTAKRKGRTVLTVNEDVTNEKYVKVNFIGNNQNTDDNDPDRLNFTTNYYQGSHSGNEQFESFGMTSIKVSVNSSYVPQVSIQFVDIRGLSFFNQTNSKYRIIFDFPPPIFTLTIKGYYGKSLTYDLHLVKYTTEFKAENGNFVIDAQFVGMTFAPLTDVLFRYIVNAPLIKWNGEGALPTVNTPPTNTNDFIIKLKSLYSALNSDAHNTSENVDFNDTSEQVAANSIATGSLNQCTETLNAAGFTSYMFTSIAGKVKILNSLSDYDAIRLNTNDDDTAASESHDDDGTDGNIPQSSKTIPKLYIGYILNTTNRVPIHTALQKYKEETKVNSYTIKGIAGGVVTDDDIKGPLQVVQDGYVKPKDKWIYYYALDVTNYYNKLVVALDNLTQKKDRLSQTITAGINSTILGHLGMQPTVYNVFKLLCDDVDEFFRILRDTSNDAENHHSKYKANISAYGGMRDFKETIFSYPLVVENQTNGGVIGEIRIAPIELSKNLAEPMPEMTLVYDFIDSFVKQKKINQLTAIMEQKLQDGSNVWIPITPLDSEIASKSTESPYVNQPSPNAIYDVLLNRFYTLSQFSIPTKFYQESYYSWWKPNMTDVSNAYIDLFAKSEAMNILVSQGSEKIINGLRTDSKNFYNNADAFYTRLGSSSEIKNYNFPDNSRKVINSAYLDRNNPAYSGVTLWFGDIAELTGSEDSPLGVFAKDVQRGGVKEFFFGVLPESSFLFTSQNVLYIKDSYVVDGKVESSDDQVVYDNVPLTTRFVSKEESIDSLGIGTYFEKAAYLVNTDLRSTSYKTAINYLVETGNYGFYQTSSILWDDMVGGNLITPAALKSFDNVVDIWVNILARTDNSIYDQIINPTTEANRDLSAIVFASNFGLTLSPYNWYKKDLNAVIFANPSIVEVPKYLPAYLGALVYMKEHNLLDKVKEFFLKHAPSSGEVIGPESPVKDLMKLHSAGLYLFADYHDVDTFMSANDKKKFLEQFDSFKKTIYPTMITGVNGAYGFADTPEINAITDTVERLTAKRKVYDSKLNPITNGLQAVYFTPVFDKFLSHDVKMVVFSETTFRITPLPSNSYTSLAFVNGISSAAKAKNNRFFTGLFSYLNTLITKQEDQKIKEEEEQKKLTGDKDIVSQMYYSFKNINDKWLTYPSHDYSATIGGYPYGLPNLPFIKNFVFVDRTMNDIGDTIINPEALIEAFNDTDVNVYSVMSKLLSLNGFLFFPLQNFMNHTRESWEDTFKITPNVSFDTVASFICMYVGGSSSYPSNINGNKSGFQNDGMDNVMDLAKGGQPNNTNIVRENSIADDPNSPWRKVKAFNVKFGQQNQSMFTDIKIDSKEFPETNESIQILARLAGDEKNNAPVQKGQNLYNLYENRAYKATITGLGNAMIQPTQYFQLDNVPLYNGAYLILGVEHNITANKMTTQFSGTKILKFPVPRVMDAAAVMGFGGDAAANAQAAGTNAQITTANSNANGNLIPTNLKPINGYAQINSPLDVNLSRYGSKYGYRKRDNPNKKQWHYGQDFPIGKGSKIYAVADGTIATQVSESESHGFGNLVTIDHGNKIYSAYAHLQSWNLTYTVGQKVKAGEVIGWAGNTGPSTYHLHFEYRIGKNKEFEDTPNGEIRYAVDPMPYLQASMPTFWAKHVKNT